MDRATPKSRATGSANRRIVLVCLAMVMAMGGLAYASVPLYRIFCQVTGYGGTTRQVQNDEGVEIVDRYITVRFDANTAPGLGWDFAPDKRSVRVRLGEITQANYFVANNTGQPLSGTATFNVTPQALGAYFNKIECFCFTDTRVAAGEKLEMPVVFYVDPQMLESEEARDVTTITLSYTFFPVETGPAPVASEKNEDRFDRIGG